jgi:hypothetical protein
MLKIIRIINAFKLSGFKKLLFPEQVKDKSAIELAITNESLGVMKVSRVVIMLFISAVILVAINVYMSLSAVDESEQAAFERKRSLITMDASVRLLSNIKDAETGLRGYLLTGEKTILNVIGPPMTKLTMN